MNELDESHEISQKLSTTEGSLWHGCMHRREGDFWNSKYWFRQAGTHPCFSLLQERISAEVFSSNPKIKKLVNASTWQPARLVDLVEEALDTEEQGLMSACVIIQTIEWESLFNYCYEVSVR